MDLSERSQTKKIIYIILLHLQGMCRTGKSRETESGLVLAGAGGMLLRGTRCH